jgi:hypothetical protein
MIGHSTVRQFLAGTRNVDATLERLLRKRRRRYLTYGVDPETGMVVSRLHGLDHSWEPCVAWPVYDFAGFGSDGDFTGPIPVNLEKMTRDVLAEGARVRWTRKIPTRIKNLHRVFWGFKPLAEGSSA